MTLDSPAAFANRIVEIGFSEDHSARFKVAGWNTLAHLAFSTPQGGTEEAFIRDIVVAGLGTPDHVDKAKLRRLYFEAFMLASDDLRRRANPVPGTTGREMGAAEREERFTRVEKRLSPGVLMRDELEPSHRLVDRCIDISESNVIKHISLELCTKRNLEIRGVEKDPEFATVLDPATGALRFKRVRDEVGAAVDGQFALGFALSRRGLALEMADLMAFEKHELLKNKFIAALMKDPISGFQRLTVAQVFEADVVFWQQMAEATRKGCRRQGAADRPCDVAMETVLKHEDFTMTMTPRLAAPSVRPSAPATLDVSSGVHTKAGLKRQRQQQLKQANKAGAPSRIQQISGSKGLGKGASKDGKVMKLPPGLHGMCSKSSAATGSKRLCFGFNLGTCSAVQPGQDCAKGAHLCMKPDAAGEACSQAHGALRCTR